MSHDDGLELTLRALSLSVILASFSPFCSSYPVGAELMDVRVMSDIVIGLPRTLESRMGKEKKHRVDEQVESAIERDLKLSFHQAHHNIHVLTAWPTPRTRRRDCGARVADNEGKIRGMAPRNREQPLRYIR
jgi:hypothetical protein